MSQSSGSDVTLRPPRPYLWFTGLSGVRCVQLLEHPFVLGLEGLLFVDVVHLRLPAAKHQNHGTRLHPFKVKNRP